MWYADFWVREKLKKWSMKFVKPTHFPCVGFPLRFFLKESSAPNIWKKSNNQSGAECWGYRGSFNLFQWFQCLCHPSPAFMNISNFIFHPQDKQKWRSIHSCGLLKDPFQIRGVFWCLKFGCLPWNFPINGTSARLKLPSLMPHFAKESCSS